ncbi:MAG TPA: carbohydrate kinase family protein [Hyphomicrobiaceae bacterium]|nr:carbohydrate kinase family protein [Hyphomicrobiaceae bacterium]
MKALTVGGAMIDTIAIIESDRIERMTMFNADTSFLLLEEGRKTEASEISTHCGGGAVNTAIAMARLGHDVAALIKLGRDERAETILARLMQEGVSTRWVVRDGRAPTGASVLISSHDRNAAIFTFRGANTLLEPGDLKTEAFAVDLVHVASLSNKSADCFPLIIERAKSQGALVSANPGVRQLSARGGAFQQCLQRIDVLSINRAEADVLVPSLVAAFGEGRPSSPLAADEEPPPLAVRGLEGGGFVLSLWAFMGNMRQLGARYVLLTDGRGGAFLGRDDEVLYCPALEAQVVGTAGAGDAFTATFSAFIAQGRPPEQALMAAALNATSVLGFADTQSGLLTAEELERRLKGGEVGVPIRRWRLR